MGIHLPDGVRAALVDEGISSDDVLLMTGDELRGVIGGQLTYELVVALAGQRLTVARWSGRPGKLPPDDLIERNLDILKLRIVDGLNFAQIGREVGLTNSRVSEILRIYFGVDKKPSPPRRELLIPVAALDVMRDALLELLTGRIEDMATEARTPKFPETLAAFDRARYVLNDVGWEPRDHEVDVDLYLGRDRDAIVREALTDGLATHRYLTDTHDEKQRRRAEASVATITRLLEAMPDAS
jgi:hypothetical protein